MRRSCELVKGAMQSRESVTEASQSNHAVQSQSEVKGTMQSVTEAIQGNHTVQSRKPVKGTMQFSHGSQWREPCSPVTEASKANIAVQSWESVTGARKFSRSQDWWGSCHITDNGNTVSHIHTIDSQQLPGLAIYINLNSFQIALNSDNYCCNLPN